GRLYDLLEVVIEIVRKRGRTGRRSKSEQTPFRQRTELGTVEGSRTPAGRRFACARINQERRLTTSCFRLHGRNLSVRWIDDDRGSVLAVHRDDLRAAGEPEIVVAADRTSAEAFQDFQIRFRR